MDRLEELLPGIDDFLTNILCNESLSSLAERKRQYYIERLEILRLPPSLPPRPAGAFLHSEGLPRLLQSDDGAPPLTAKTAVPSRSPRVQPRNSKHIGDFAAQQRQIAREQSKSSLDNLVNGDAKIHPDYEEADFYHDLDNECHRTPQDDGTELHYETPMQLDEDFQAAKSYASSNDGLDQTADESSGTSYESYDEEEKAKRPQQSPRYDDIPLPSSPIDDIVMRIKGKKKKKKELKDRKGSSQALSEFSLKNLTSVSVCGDLDVKGLLSWSRRYCAINDNLFLVYKSERDTGKPLHKIPLFGYEVVYVGKEGRRSHVMKVVHPGCETLWLSVDATDAANNWMNKLQLAVAITNGVEIPADSKVKGMEKSVSFSTFNGVSTEIKPPEDVSNELSLVLSDGEGAKTDTASTNTKDADISANRKKASSKFTKRASNFFSFGKKKGRKAAEIMEIGEATLDMESEGAAYAPISDHLNVFSKSVGHAEWVERWCVIERGLFEFYVHAQDEECEFRFPLDGCEVLTAKDTGRDLAIRIMQGDFERVIIEPHNTLRQGTWVKKLIKETGCGLRGNKSDLRGKYDDVYEEAVGDVLEHEDLNYVGDPADILYDDVVVDLTGSTEGSSDPPSLNSSGGPSSLGEILQAFNQKVKDLDVSGSPRTKRTSSNISSDSNSSRKSEETEKLKDELDDLRRDLGLSKRKREIARDRKIHARQPEDKAQHEADYNTLNAQYKDTEANIKRLQQQLDKLNEGRKLCTSSLLQQFEQSQPSSRSSSARSSRTCEISDKASEPDIASNTSSRYRPSQEGRSKVSSGSPGLRQSPGGSPRSRHSEVSRVRLSKASRLQESATGSRSKRSPAGSPRLRKRELANGGSSTSSLSNRSRCDSKETTSYSSKPDDDNIEDETDLLLKRVAQLKLEANSITEVKPDDEIERTKENAKRNIMNALSPALSRSESNTSSRDDKFQYMTNFERLRAEQRAEQRAKLSAELRDTDGTTVGGNNNAIRTKIKELSEKSQYRGRRRPSTGSTAGILNTVMNKFEETGPDLYRRDRRLSVDTTRLQFASENKKLSVRDKLKEWEKLEK